MTEINFNLNGEKRSIDFNKLNISPTTTLLEYLREYESLTGTKEGCGVGECGACTVTLAQYNTEQKVEFISVNSCLLLLPMIDGKAIFTIECLSKNGGNIHPIQQSLLEHSGSQCGFCTPGMAMSAYAHYRSNGDFSKENIKSVLSGNICRCTGYKSIIESMEAIDNYSYKEEGLPILPEERKENFLYLSEDLTYIKPSSLENALKYRAKYPKSNIISGATDILIMLRKGNKNLHNVYIDISDILELKNIEIRENDIKLGSCAPIEKIRKTLSKIYPTTNYYLSSFASLQIRNKATMGGSIGGSSPVGDIMPLLIALDADIEVISANNERHIYEAANFITSYRKNQLKEDEIISNIYINKPVKNSFLFCHKQSKRKDIDIATMTFCLYMEYENNKVTKLQTGFGGMAAIPTNSCSAEEFLSGADISLANFTKAGEIAAKDFTPITDVRGSAEQRELLIKNLFIKTFSSFENEK